MKKLSLFSILALFSANALSAALWTSTGSVGTAGQAKANADVWKISCPTAPVGSYMFAKVSMGNPVNGNILAYTIHYNNSKVAPYGYDFSENTGYGDILWIQRTDNNDYYISISKDNNGSDTGAKDYTVAAYCRPNSDGTGTQYDTTGIIVQNQ